MYNIISYGSMIGDRSRTGTYARALRRAIGPDSVVLDIGAGPGILTLLACQAGARKVYAVEPDGSIEVAREAVAANGFADRVQFVQALSTEITLPEPVDVIVSDIHGNLPLFGSCLLSIQDARDRFLKSSGTIIPLRDILCAAIVSAPDEYLRIVDPWENCFGFEYEAARRRAVNTRARRRLARESVLVEPQAWAILDYPSLKELSVRGEAAWTIVNSSAAHGLGVWFDCEAALGIGFSNAPGLPSSRVYNQFFFPWPKVRHLEPGEKVSVEIRADFVGEEYLFSWNTEIYDAMGVTKEHFRQSEFYGSSLAIDRLRKSGSDFLPSLNPEGAIDKMILNLFSDGLKLEEISHRVAACFPERFPDCHKALTRVRELSVRYSQ